METKCQVSGDFFCGQLGNLPRVTTAPTVPCCDLCSPELLDKTRPAPPLRNSRKKGQIPGMTDKELKKAIIRWRGEIWSRDFGDSLLGPSAILSNAAVNSLSLFGQVE